MSLHIIFVAFLYSFYLFSPTVSEECKFQNSCKCVFENNGTGIDLKPLNETIYKTVLPDEKDNTFYFNACGYGSKINLPAHNGTSCDDDFAVIYLKFSIKKLKFH